MCKCADRNAFTHSPIRAKAPPSGIEAAALTYAAQNVTQLTKYESVAPQISHPRRTHIENCTRRRRRFKSPKSQADWRFRLFSVTYRIPEVAVVYGIAQITENGDIGSPRIGDIGSPILRRFGGFGRFRRHLRLPTLCKIPGIAETTAFSAISVI